MWIAPYRFITRADLCNHHHSQDQELLCHYEDLPPIKATYKGYPFIATLTPSPHPANPLPPSLSPATHVSHFYSSAVSRILHKRNQTVCDLWGLAFYNQNNALQIHPGCVGQWSLCFYCQVVFHGRTYQFV